MGQQAFTKVLARVAEKHGFTVDDVAWAFNGCQGDGCSFTGDIELEVFIQRFINRVLREDTELAMRARTLVDEQAISLRVRRDINQYTHHNTVSVEADYRPLDEWDEPTQTAFDAVIGEIEAEAKDLKDRVCWDMEALGKGFCDACICETQVLYREAIGDEAIVIRMEPEECSIDLFPGWYDDDAESIESHIALLAEMRDAPYGAFVVGRLELVHVRANGLTDKVIEQFGGLFDRREGDDQFVESFDEISALRTTIKTSQRKPKQLPMAA